MLLSTQLPSFENSGDLTPIEIQYTPSQTHGSFKINEHEEVVEIYPSEQDILRKNTPPTTPPITTKSNTALMVIQPKTYALVTNLPYPKLLSDGEILISSRAIGLNPIDWKSVDFNFCLPEYPWITGREMSGVVEAVGKNVLSFKPGDRVWTSTYYKDRRAGCFQQYVTVPQHTVSSIPENLDFESAAALGVGGLTAAMTLWKWLDVAMPLPAMRSPLARTSSNNSSGGGEYLLIWGGSAVTAQFAIQIAVQGGLNVIAVTSEKTQHLALSLGASEVVTRDGKTNEEIVSEIRHIAGDTITRAIDFVGTETAVYCLQALSATQSCLFAPLATISSKIAIPAHITVQTVEMKQFVLNSENKVYAEVLQRLVREGKLVMPGIELIRGGLTMVQGGLERLKRGDMAGRKLVISMSN